MQFELIAIRATDEKAKVAKIDLMATNAAKEKKERRVKDGDEPGSDGAEYVLQMLYCLC